MRRLRLEHRGTGSIDRRVSVCALLCALAIAGATAWQAAALAEEADLLQQRLGQARRAPEQAGSKRHTDKRAASAQQAEARQAGIVLDQLALPWTQMFQAIEACATPDVSLLAVDPAPEQRTVKLSGEARNMAALVNYLRQLGMSPFFSSVYLQSHHVEQGDALKPVRFVLLLGWARPA